jgi:methionyl-tRNA formyltransferase
LIATGQGALEVRELQPAGKRRMTAAEFLRGRPTPPARAT